MRIVSLLPSTTEIVGSLGLAEYLVGISHECDFPASCLHPPQLTSSIIPHGLSQGEIDTFVREAVRNGVSLYSVDGEKLKQIEPDLILTQGLCDVCAVTPTTVEASLRGVRCSLSTKTSIISTVGRSMEGIFQDVRVIAKATKREHVAEELIGQYQQRINHIKKLETPLSILGLEWVEPYFSAGHWVPEQLIAVGGSSAIGSPSEHSRTLQVEEICAANPDIIIVLCCGFGLQENIEFAQKIYQEAQFKNMQAVQNEQVWAIDANSYCSRPTLRVIDGAVLISNALHGSVDTRAIQRVKKKS